MIKFYIEVCNRYGYYESEIFEGDKEKFMEFVNTIESIYDENIWSMWLQDGSYYIMNNDLIKESLFIIRLVDNEE